MAINKTGGRNEHTIEARRRQGRYFRSELYSRPLYRGRKTREQAYRELQTAVARTYGQQLAMGFDGV